MTLTSQNLILRRLKKSDKEEFYDIMGNKEVMDPIPLPTISKNESDSHLLEVIENKEIDIFAITKKNNENLIGIVALTRDNEILYRLRPKYWGKGYAKEAVSIFIDYVFLELKKEYITAEANKSNIASIKILTKFMIKTGEYFSKDLNCTNVTFKKLAITQG
tara:strand:- start:31 stop:516 length:486 start_codon:yes stop_codon:yes gene_type:complete